MTDSNGFLACVAGGCKNGLECGESVLAESTALELRLQSSTNGQYDVRFFLLDNLRWQFRFTFFFSRLTISRMAADGGKTYLFARILVPRRDCEAQKRLTPSSSASHLRDPPFSTTPRRRHSVPTRVKPDAKACPTVECVPDLDACPREEMKLKDSYGVTLGCQSACFAGIDDPTVQCCVSSGKPLPYLSFAFGVGRRIVS